MGVIEDFRAARESTDPYPSAATPEPTALQPQTPQEDTPDPSTPPAEPQSKDVALPTPPGDFPVVPPTIHPISVEQGATGTGSETSKPGAAEDSPLAVPPPPPDAPAIVPNVAEIPKAPEGQKFGELPKQPPAYQWQIQMKDPQTAQPKTIQGPSLPEQIFYGITDLSRKLLGGLGEGVVTTADQAKALVETPGRLSGQNTTPYQSWQEDYNKMRPAGDVGTLPSEAGKLIGQVGSYAAGAIGTGAALAAAGVSAPVAGAGAGALMLGEAALSGMAASAQQQLKDPSKKGKLDPAQLGIDATINMGLAGAGVWAGNTIKKVAGDIARKGEIKELSKTMGDLSQTAKSLTDDAQKLLKDIENEIHRREAAAVKLIDEVFNQEEPINVLQQKQKEFLEAAAQGPTVAKQFLDKFLGKAEPEREDLSKVFNGLAGAMSANFAKYIAGAIQKTGKLPPRERNTAFGKEVQKRIIEPGLPATEENLLAVARGLPLPGEGTPAPPAAPLQGGVEENVLFRRPIYGKGYEPLEHVVPLEQFQWLPSEQYKKLSVALKEIGHAKAAKMHWELEQQAQGQHALSLAANPEEMAKIGRREETRLRSGAQAQKDKAKAELTRQQMQIEKEAAEAEKARLEGELKTIRSSARKGIIEKIGHIDAALKRLSNPFLDLVEGHHIKGMADKSADSVFALESTKRRVLKGTFDEAYQDFVKADKNVKDFSRAYDEVKAKHQPLLAEVEKQYQEQFGLPQDSPLYGHAIAHPLNPNVSTTMGTQLQFNPITVRLNKFYADVLAVIDAELRAQADNLATEIIYTVKGIERLEKRTRKKALENIKELDLHHPMAKSLALAASLGVTAMSSPAQAANVDEMTPEQQRHYFGSITGLVGISGAVAATALVAMFGHAGARRVSRLPQNYYAAITHFTHECAGLADQALGAISKDASLRKSLDELRGLYIKAGTLSPDYKTYFVRTLAGEMDDSLLSDQAKQFAAQIKEQEKDLGSFVKGYAKEWGAYYQALPEAQKERMRHIDDSISFLQASYSNVPIRNMADRALSGVFKNTARALFVSNPRNILAATTADLFTVGPLKVGPMAFYRAYFEYMAKPSTRQLVGRLELGGPRTEALNAVGGEPMKPFAVEKIQNQVLALASTKRYYATHRPTMDAIGVTSESDLAQKVFTGQLREDVLDDVFLRIGRDLAESTGGDPLGLDLNLLERSSIAGKIMRFSGQPMRDARLYKINAQQMINNINQGEYGNALTRAGWMLSSLAGRWQFGGKAVLPASLAVGAAANPMTAEMVTKLQGFLNMSSMGHQVMGDISRLVDWDPFLSPVLGVNSPGLDQVLGIIADFPGLMGQVGAVHNLFQQGRPQELVTGTKADKDVEKAQKSLHTLLNTLSILIPELGPIPVQAVSAGIYSAPEVINAEAYFGIPRPGIGDAAPLEGAKVRYYEPSKGEIEQYGREGARSRANFRARVNALRRAARLPIGAEEAQYIQAAQGLKLGGESPELRQMQEATGIYP